MNRAIAIALFASLVPACAMAVSPEDIQRILHAPEVTNAIRSFETTQKVDCMDARETQIGWRCVNGPYCGFTVMTTCTSRRDTFSTNDTIYQLSIDGDWRGATAAAGDALPGTITFSPAIRNVKISGTPDIQPTN